MEGHIEIWCCCCCIQFACVIVCLFNQHKNTQNVNRTQQFDVTLKGLQKGTYELLCQNALVKDMYTFEEAFLNNML